MTNVPNLRVFIEKCFQPDPNQPFALLLLYEEFYEATARRPANGEQYHEQIVECCFKHCQEEIQRIGHNLQPISGRKLASELHKYFVGAQRVSILLSRHLRRFLGEEAFLCRLNQLAAQQLLLKHSDQIVALLRSSFVDYIRAETLLGPPKEPLEKNVGQILECIVRIGQPEIHKMLVTHTLLDIVQSKALLVPKPKSTGTHRNWISFLQEIQALSKQLYFSLLTIFCTKNQFIPSDFCIFPEQTPNPEVVNSCRRSAYITSAYRIRQIMSAYKVQTYQKYSTSIFEDFVEDFIPTIKPFDKFRPLDIDTKVLNLFFMYNSPDNEFCGSSVSLDGPATVDEPSKISTVLESYTRLQKSVTTDKKIKTPKGSNINVIMDKFMMDFVAIAFRTFGKRYLAHEKILQSAPRSLDQWHYSVFHLFSYVERFMTIVTQRVFFNNHRFIEIWRPKMAELVNSKPAHTQCDNVHKCLVFLVHRSLNTARACEPSTFEVIAHGMSLYKYFREKEYFENWYRTKLANRLLSPIQVCLPDEVRVVKAMINQLDIGYVNSLESMINDIDSSMQKTAIFSNSGGPELRVCSLNEFFWKSSLPVQPNIVDILPCYKDFAEKIKEKYKQMHPHRILNFIHNASWCVIEYSNSAGNSCNVVFTFQQHMIIEEMNKIDPKTLRLSQIEDIFKNIFTGIEIRRALQLLTKFELIVKSQKSTGTTEDPQYSINKRFLDKSEHSLVNIGNKSNRSMVNVTSLRQGSSLEAFGKVIPKKANQAECLKQTSTWTVEACIVRVLKGEKSKTLDYRLLRAAVIEQLRSKHNRLVDGTSVQRCVQKLRKERYLISQNLMFDGSKTNLITYLP